MLPPPLTRRACRQCFGTGVYRSPMGGAPYACPRCHGEGTVAPRGHFDAMAIGKDEWPGDGCGSDHAYVVNPCVLCGKAPIDLRHTCTLIVAEKPCTHAPAHHGHVAGATEPSTREGCREHGVDRDYVLRWWGVADQQGREAGVCWCCLGPCPLNAQGHSREQCYRCLPRAEEVAA